jgi:transposase-like protein
MKALSPAVAKVLKRLHYPLEIMLVCVRWYVAYPLSLRNLEEMMAERGIAVDHSTVHRWAIKLLPVLRDKEAARRYLEKAIDQNGAPETVTIDKSGANLAGLRAVNSEPN